ncbi:hypothetical protein ACFSY7_13175 [Kurthia populi]|uniref:Uncharacterized protein n=1 Tax=Kurthia populi TaxID=1562132 RepID=A0ABW5Y289_9BACL|nr:hypothetical protein [Kurthia sp. Dielmo]
MNLKKVISTAVKLAPVVYPIVKKVLNNKKASQSTNRR